MKTFKLSIAIRALIAILFSVAIAESDCDFEIQGEWYVGMIYENGYHSIYLDEYGRYVCDTWGAIINKDGLISSIDSEADDESQSLMCSVFHVDESLVLFYTCANECIEVYLVSEKEDVIRLYMMECVPVLFIDGEIINRKSSVKEKYLCQGDMLYITKDNTYLRSYVEYHGNDLFIFEANPGIDNRKIQRLGI